MLVTGILQACGGLGLFLMGMAVMTDGLKTLADERLRTLLARSTRSPLAGVFTGGISTAILQSSSATTVAAIGFVSAGLLTFSQALGIVFGANLGTTFTGWLVAVLGFKLKLGEIVLPLVLAGVLLRLFGRGRVAAAGFSIAGFGLIFVGIAMLQEGMMAFEGVVTPATFPSDTLRGRLALVLIGIVVTLITQSSSAGVATALAALNTGTITLSQAAALVIGMNVGTTSTALLATIGATTQARRTAMGHVLFNVLTAFLALLILTPYVRLVDRFSSQMGSSEPELALVAFHTLFNGLGLVVILPFTKRFAAFITRLVPERGNPLTRRLEQSLLTTPEVAIQAVRATILDLVRHVFDQLATMLLSRRGTKALPWIAEVEDALEQTTQYLRQIQLAAQQPVTSLRHESSFHILDHLRRLIVRTRNLSRMAAVHADLQLQELAEQLADDARGASQAAGSIDDTVAARMHANYRELKSHEKPYRRRIIENSVSGQIDASEALTRLDAMRWLRRVGYHVWRIVRHLHVLDASDEVLARALQRKLDQDNQEAPESSQDAPVPGLRL